MEEHSLSSATSGDNFESFMADPLRVSRPIPSPLRDISSPSFKPTQVSNDGKATKSPVSPRSASLSTPKPSFISNFGQPWGLFHAEEGTEAVKHPLMADHPLSDEEDEEDSDEAKLPTASAASTTQTFSNSPEAVTSARPVLNPSPLSYGSRSFQGSSELPSLRKLAVQLLFFLSAIHSTHM